MPDIAEVRPLGAISASHTRGKGVLQSYVEVCAFINRARHPGGSTDNSQIFLIVLVIPESLFLLRSPKVWHLGRNTGYPCKSSAARRRCAIATSRRPPICVPIMNKSSALPLQLGAMYSQVNRTRISSRILNKFSNQVLRTVVLNNSINRHKRSLEYSRLNTWCYGSLETKTLEGFLAHREPHTPWGHFH